MKETKDRRSEEEEDKREFRGRFGGGMGGRGGGGRGDVGRGGGNSFAVRGRDRHEGSGSRGFMMNRSISGRDARGCRNHSNAGSRQERRDGQWISLLWHGGRRRGGRVARGNMKGETAMGVILKERGQEGELCLQWGRTWRLCSSKLQGVQKSWWW